MRDLHTQLSPAHRTHRISAIPVGAKEGREERDERKSPRHRSRFGRNPEAEYDMNRHSDPNPFDEEEVNPFANAGGPGSKSRVPPTATEPLGFGRKHDATVDIPLDNMNDSKKKEKDLAAWEADLKRREKDIKRREDAVSRGNLCDIEVAYSIVLCLSWNVIAVTVCWVRGGEQIVPSSLFHIGFCIFAAIAPPIVFHGKSLTLWVLQTIRFQFSE
ncbi:Secretory carrier-associated membrane protein 5 [Asimina triloba]